MKASGVYTRYFFRLGVRFTVGIDPAVGRMVMYGFSDVGVIAYISALVEKSVWTRNLIVV